MLLEDRVAIVSGIGPGLGRSIALALAEQGADLVLGARRERPLAELAQEVEALGRRARYAASDVTRDEDCRALVELARQELGGLDVVVANAAGFNGDPLLEGDIDDYRKVMDVTLFGTLRLVRAALPALRARGGGRVILTGTMAIRDPQPGQGMYAAAKAALAMVTRTLAQELGPDGIRVNTFSPGYVQGENIQASFRARERREGRAAAEIEAEIAGWSPLGYIPAPDEIAGTVVYLASDLSRPVTGHVLDCNAGMWM